VPDDAGVVDLEGLPDASPEDGLAEESAGWWKLEFVLGGEVASEVGEGWAQVKGEMFLNLITMHFYYHFTIKFVKAPNVILGSPGWTGIGKHDGVKAILFPQSFVFSIIL
jgi:hypothetical protein